MSQSRAVIQQNFKKRKAPATASDDDNADAVSLSDEWVLVTGFPICSLFYRKRICRLTKILTLDSQNKHRERG